MKRNYLLCMVCAVMLVSCSAKTEQQIAEGMVLEDLKQMLPGKKVSLTDTQLRTYDEKISIDTAYYVTAVYDDDDDYWFDHVFDVDSLQITKTIRLAYNEYTVHFEAVEPNGEKWSMSLVKTFSNGKFFDKYKETPMLRDTTVVPSLRRYYLEDGIMSEYTTPNAWYKAHQLHLFKGNYEYEEFDVAE